MNFFHTCNSCSCQNNCGCNQNITAPIYRPSCGCGCECSNTPSLPIMPRCGSQTGCSCSGCNSCGNSTGRCGCGCNCGNNNCNCTYTKVSTIIPACDVCKIVNCSVGINSVQTVAVNNDTVASISYTVTLEYITNCGCTKVSTSTQTTQVYLNQAPAGGTEPSAQVIFKDIHIPVSYTHLDVYKRQQ